jgi:mRNA interferase MazF
MTGLLRGQVIWFQLREYGRKPGVVVSHDTRNRALRSALVARITTAPKPALHSIVELGDDDPVAGRVLCDDLIEVYEDEMLQDAGTLTPASLDAVNLGLLHALGL